MSGPTIIVSVRMQQQLLDDIRAAMIRRYISGRTSDKNLGAWIRLACVEKLNHLDRSEKSPCKTFTCNACKRRRPVVEMAYSCLPLGERVKKYMCKGCDSNGHQI